MIISPSILSADFARLGEQIAILEAAGCTCLHLDVMDGRFVPNISFGVPVVASLRHATTMSFYTHLMIRDPLKFTAAFSAAGSDAIIFHIEACPNPEYTRALFAEIKRLGRKCGVALNPETPAQAMVELLPHIDHALVMSVMPGFGGQSFIRESLEKISILREYRTGLGLRFEIGVDGGVTADNLGDLVLAGADRAVVGSAIFAKEDPGAAFAALMAGPRH